MMKRISKIWCWVVGHDWLETGTFVNDHSCSGEYNCMRCNKVQSWSYAYQ